MSAIISVGYVDKTKDRERCKNISIILLNPCCFHTGTAFDRCLGNPSVGSVVGSFGGITESQVGGDKPNVYEINVYEL